MPRWLRTMVLVSVGLLMGGFTSNKLVIYTNGGKMPVAMQKEDVLFVIGEPELGVEYFLTAHFLEAWRPRHQPLTRDMKFRILADRIPASLGFAHYSKPPSWYRQALIIVGIPVGDDAIVSIGDLLIWMGFVVTLLNLTICLIRGIFPRLSGKV